MPKYLNSVDEYVWISMFSFVENYIIAVVPTLTLSHLATFSNDVCEEGK
jgi:hypothetical protein